MRPDQDSHEVADVERVSRVWQGLQGYLFCIAIAGSVPRHRCCSGSCQQGLHRSKHEGTGKDLQGQPPRWINCHPQEPSALQSTARFSAMLPQSNRAAAGLLQCEGAACMHCCCRPKPFE